MAWSEAARLAAAKARAMATARTNVRKSLKVARNQGRKDAAALNPLPAYSPSVTTSTRASLANRLKQHKANLKSTSTGSMNAQDAGKTAQSAGYSTKLRNLMRQRKK